MPAEFDANKNLNTPQSEIPASSVPESDDERMWELLSLYADGEASQEQASQVEQMLRHDAEYARAYTFMQKAGGAIRTIVEIEPPAHLRDAILAKTTRKPTLARRAAVVFGAFRAQLAMPAGRLAFAGGGLAAAALVIGIYAGRSGSVPGVRQSAADFTAKATPFVKPNNALPATGVPVYILPDASEIAKASIPLPNDAAKPDGAKNPVTAPRPSVAPNPVIPFGPSMTLAGSGLSATPAAKPTKPTPALIMPKNSGRVIAKGEAKPSRYVEPRGTADASGTQNVTPMMDAAVQHRTAPMVIASLGSGGASGAKSMGMDMDDLNDNNVLTVHDTASATVGATDGDSSPEAGRKIVGKLMLSKLPPSARHLMSPAEAIREANSRSLVNYSAASSEETPRRSADVPVLKGSF